MENNSLYREALFSIKERKFASKHPGPGASKGAAMGTLPCHDHISGTEEASESQRTSFLSRRENSERLSVQEVSFHTGDLDGESKGLFHGQVAT